MLLKKQGLSDDSINEKTRIYLIIRCLRGEAWPTADKKGELKVKVSPTMSMKTKEGKSDILASLTMFSNTNNLTFTGHDVYEQ